MSEMIEIPSRLSDDELTAQVMRLAGSERGTTVSLVAHLAEFDTRRLHLGAGCRSLFVYCTDVLHLSEHAAYHRIEAARLARRFPVILQRLADGALNLTTARLVGPHMSAETQEALLAAVAGKGKREVQTVLAEMFPSPDVPSSIRKVPAPRSPASVAHADAQPVGIADGDASVATLSPSALSTPPSTLSTPVPADDVLSGPLPLVASTAGPLLTVSSEPATLVSAMPPPPAKPRALVRPLAADRYEVRVTVSGATREKLLLATDLLRHAVPDGDAAEVLDRALTALLEDLAKKKFAATPRPRPAPDAASATRHVPAHVKRTVWLRDGARCAFVGQGGRRCRERGFLEFHHVRPYGVGGETTVSNIELRCRSHNAHEAELFYGRRFVGGAGIEAEVELGPDRVGPGSAAARRAPINEPIERCGMRVGSES